MLKQIFELASSSGIPGGEGIFGEDGRIVYYENYGYKTLLPSPLPWTEGLYLDLASITKPLITAHLLLWLASRDEISLKDPLGKYIPHTKIPHVSLLELGAHTAGLPAWVPLYKDGPGRERMKRLLFSLEADRRGRVNYSCMGYFLLGLVIEKVAGERLGKFAEDFFAKRGMKLKIAKASPAVPTELGNRYEKQKAGQVKVRFRDYLIEGKVHDGNCFYWGGDCGNAGAFLKAEEIVKYPELFEELSDARKYALTPWKGERSFGWEIRRGLLLHHGFTGGTLLFSPQKKKIAFLYLSRTHPVVRLKEIEKPRAAFLARAFKFLKS